MCVGRGWGVFGRGAVIIWWWEEGASGQGSGGLRGAKDECDGLGGGGWCAVWRVRAAVGGGGGRGVSVGNGVSCRGSRESRHLNKTAPG